MRGALILVGGLTFVAVDKRSGENVVTKQAGKRFVVRLGAGRYRLRSWVRPCDGNCGYLDPPADQCARRFAVRGRSLVATIRQHPGTPCRIIFRHA